MLRGAARWRRIIFDRYIADIGERSHLTVAPPQAAVMDAISAVQCVFVYGECERKLLHTLALAMLALAPVTFIALQFRPATYGRYARSEGGILVPGRLAWIVQELPSVLIPCYTLACSSEPLLSWRTVLIGAFLVHYIHRTFVFPLRITNGKPTELTPFLLAILFTTLNGYMQSRWLAAYAPDYGAGDMPWLLAGLSIFLTGMAINIHSDGILLGLRKHSGAQRYVIPRGGLFEFVSGANFAGEILEWCGFALAARTLPAFAFAAFTFSNIGPRAVQHHAFYRAKFDNYPRARRALIPFVW